MALPCALVLFVVVLALGPPLGRALFEPTGANHIWPRFFELHGVRPEPTEHARYVLTLLGPLLVVGAGQLLRGRRLPAVVPGVATLAAQLALVAFVVVCIVAQREHVYEIAFTGGKGAPRTVFFTVPTLVVAAALALLTALALSRPAAVERIARATRETPSRRALALAAAALVTVAYLLSAFNTDGTINIAHVALWDHTAFYVDEAFSILNGQAPLVDFHAQYGHLWAYVAAGGLTLFGASLGVYAAIMLTGTAATMAAVFATMRRLVGGSSLQTLALFGPFVATSFFMKLGPPENRYSPVSLFSLFPIRYFGPYVLLWLLVRRLDSGSTRRALPLLALAGLVVINNPEFGVPGVGATLVALAWTLPDRSAARARAARPRSAGGRRDRRRARVGAHARRRRRPAALRHAVRVPAHLRRRRLRPAADAVDRLPPRRLRDVRGRDRRRGGARAGRRGPRAERRARVGRDLRARRRGVLHGPLAPARPDRPLLRLVVRARAARNRRDRAIQRRPGRRPQIAELLVFAGLGAMVCSLAQIPTPWSQIERIRDSQPHAVRVVTALEEAMRRVTRPGEPVAVLVRPGHQISEEIGIVDVTPYANIDSMMTEQQWAKAIDALERAHGRKLFVQKETLFQEHVDWLAARGYKPYVEWRTLALIGFIKGRRPAGGAPPRPTRRSARP